MVNICTIVTGRTLNAHKAFVDNLAAKIHLTEVTLDECDVILDFCPISSRSGTDIDAALGKIPADKPVILVVMHHISDPNHRLYPSSNFVARSNVFTVDCLFHEAKGFFKSTANDTAVEQTLEHMRKYAKEPPPPAQKPAEKRPPAQESAVRNSPQNPHPAQDVTPTQQHKKRETCKRISAPLLGHSKSLREKISDISSTAAENLCAAEISDAQTLTLLDLSELLPGIQNFQTRREIMALISQHCEKSSKSLTEKISDISSTAAESLRVKVHIVGEIPIGGKVFLNNLGVQILECNLEQCSVILILCPATGFEIKAALSKIPDNKEAILVLMHQTSDTFHPRRFMDATRQKGNIVETVNYLLYQSTGKINEQAISRVWSALERYGRE